jgi:hypothetical protein
MVLGTLAIAGSVSQNYSLRFLKNRNSTSPLQNLDQVKTASRQPISRRNSFHLPRNRVSKIHTYSSKVLINLKESIPLLIEWWLGVKHYL